MSTKEPDRGIQQMILDEINKMGRGSVFTPVSFLNIGSRNAVDVALNRLTKAGTIRRLARGLYDYPKKHLAIGTLSPSVDKIAKAIAERNGSRLLPAGAYAANILRLSEQVPAKTVFLTNGPSKTVQVGRQTIGLKHTSLRLMNVSSQSSGVVIAALKYLGQKHVDYDRISHLKQLLSGPDKEKLKEDLPLAPAWMHPYLRNITEKDNAHE
jgi:hypothetical protein